MFYVVYMREWLVLCVGLVVVSLWPLVASLLSPRTSWWLRTEAKRSADPFQTSEERTKIRETLALLHLYIMETHR